jgi:hypothetical protein
MEMPTTTGKSRIDRYLAARHPAPAAGGARRI